MKENRYFMVNTTWGHHAFLLIFWNIHRQALKGKHRIHYHCVYENGCHLCSGGNSPLPEEGRWEGLRGAGVGGWKGTKQLVLRIQVTLSL